MLSSKLMGRANVRSAQCTALSRRPAARPFTRARAVSYEAAGASVMPVQPAPAEVRKTTLRLYLAPYEDGNRADTAEFPTCIHADPNANLADSLQSMLSVAANTLGCSLSIRNIAYAASMQPVSNLSRDVGHKDIVVMAVPDTKSAQNLLEAYNEKVWEEARRQAALQAALRRQRGRKA